MTSTERVVWITGASSGIGESLAHAYRRRGARVVLSARRREELERVRDACGGDGAHVLPFDVADGEQITAATEAAIAAFGRVDVLINNAGITQRSLAQDTDLAVYRRLIEVDLLAPIALARCLLPHLLERGSGTLVAVSSIAGKIGAPLRTGYCAAKHGLHGFHDALRYEVTDAGVQVSLVVAGPIRTEISMHALTGDGHEHGQMDPMQQRAIGPDAAAEEIVRGVDAGRHEILVGMGGRFGLALWLKRLAPGWLDWMMSRSEPT